MTLQEIFTRVATHLLTQNVQSLDSFDGSCRCMYRGNDGTRCAVGCLIADEHYGDELENTAYNSDTLVRKAVIASIGPLPDRADKLLRSLQRVHDMSPVWRWRADLLNLTEVYDLEMPND